MDDTLGRFYARSASDKTDDWPFWFVADRRRGDLNVTAELICELVYPLHKGAIFLPQKAATLLADKANKRGL